MKIGLVGPSYQERSLPFDAQRSINLFPVLDQQGKDVSALYGTPGLSLFSTAGIGPVRGEFTASNGRAFAVSNTGLYEITSDGASTLLGSLDASSNIVSIDENGLQLAMCDGASVYILTYATNVFAKVVDGDLPASGTITFIDGYFVINKVDSGAFYISALYDGTSWAALDFATAESSPDNLLRVYNAVGQLWLLGKYTGEIWTNTGAASFPFERISGAKMEVGILAPHTAIAVDNSIFWVGQDRIGSGIVYRAQGFSPSRISTNAIELLLQQAPSPSTLRAYTYQQDGHTFYVITGGGMSTTLVYDISTQLWHERAHLNSLGVFEQHLGCCAMYAFGKQLVGSRLNGKIYEMDLDFYTDDGAALKRQRTFTHLYDEGKRFKANQLQVDFEYGSSNAEYLFPMHSIPSSLATDYDNSGGNISVLITSGTNTLIGNQPSSTRYQDGDRITYSGFSGFDGIADAIMNTSHVMLEYTPGSFAAGLYKILLSVYATSLGSDTPTFATGLITVTAASHGLSNGDKVRISGALDAGGILAADINGDFTIRNVAANSFDIMTNTAATSAVTGAGGVNIKYQKIQTTDEPLAWLEISNDLARTWSNEYQASIGALGNYTARAKWRRLGVSDRMTFRVSISDAVKVAICGAYLT